MGDDIIYVRRNIWIMKLMVAVLLAGCLLAVPSMGRRNADAAQDEFILHGKIVTMVSEEDVFDGYILVSEGKVAQVWRTGEQPPTDITGITSIDTHGIIFPGLVDIHNHVMYNVFPLWNSSKTYDNRYQWSAIKQYKIDISKPKGILEEKKLVVESMKYAEVKALVGGTTSIQGSPQENKEYSKMLVRNVEHRNFGEKRVYQNVGDIAEIDNSRNVKQYNNIQEKIAAGDEFAYLLHVAEGKKVDPRTAGEFDTLASKNLVKEPVVVIHGTGLSEDNLQAMADSDMKMVWSPLSNLLLYGETADVAAASEKGVLLSLAPDWSPSGSKNLLGELKVADWWNKNRLGRHFSSYQLVEMVTVNPAKTIKWDSFVGTIQEGLYADLLVIKNISGNPYRALVRALDNDVLLVTVNGDPLYGKAGWMEKLKPNDYEEVGCSGWKKGLDVTSDPEKIAEFKLAKGSQTWQEITNKLNEAMTFESANYDGTPLHPIQLDPLFTSCDPLFFNTLDGSPADLPFDLCKTYYAPRLAVDPC